MIKHQRVQMAPVHIRARFCVRESWEAGRVKSAAPARTSPHCLESLVLRDILRLPLRLSILPCVVESYLHDRRPEMHRLGPDLTVPHLHEAALVFHRIHTLRRARSASPLRKSQLGLDILAEERAEGLAGAEAEACGHRCCR